MSEKIIWNNLRNGDKKALEAIYRNYFEELFSYGRKFSSDTSLVEDSIQELFIELWNNRKGLSETDKIKPYLYVAIRRKIFNQVKKNIKNTGTELKEQHFDAVLSFEHILIQKETSQDQQSRIENAFAELSERQKEILYLKFYSNMDYETISEVMDMNYQSARNLVSRAIAKLSKVLSMQLLVFLLYSIK